MVALMTSHSKTFVIRLLYTDYYSRMRTGEDVSLYRPGGSQLVQHCITQAHTSYLIRQLEDNGLADQERRKKFLYGLARKGVEWVKRW